MTKKLDTTSITSELAGSDFFPLNPRPSTEQPPSRPARVATVLEVPKTAPVPAATAVPAKPKRQHAATSALPPATSRPYVRRTFDVFEDQLAYLNRASLEDRLAGGEASMNAMVRDAIDAFIEKRKRK
jgi:hypothetical protein